MIAEFFTDGESSLASPARSQPATFLKEIEEVHR